MYASAAEFATGKRKTTSRAPFRSAATPPPNTPPVARIKFLPLMQRNLPWGVDNDTAAAPLLDFLLKPQGIPAVGHIPTHAALPQTIWPAASPGSEG